MKRCFPLAVCLLAGTLLFLCPADNAAAQEKASGNKAAATVEKEQAAETRKRLRDCMRTCQAGMRECLDVCPPHDPLADHQGGCESECYGDRKECEDDCREAARKLRGDGQP